MPQFWRVPDVVLAASAAVGALVVLQRSWRLTWRAESERAIKKRLEAASITDGEYDTLEALNVDAPATIASQPANKARTRSPKLPHDAHLVQLSGDRFINATRVVLHEAPQLCFIATQAPLDPSVYGEADTRADFWQLVMEQTITTVVCLSKVVDGRNGCPQYWPSEGVLRFPLDTPENESVEVSLVQQDQHEGIVVRTLHLVRCTELGPSEPQVVTHVQFLEWPDYGVPTCAEAILKLVNIVEQHQHAGAAPLLVHCSAGHGRTGCFISIYALLVARLGSSALMAAVKQLRSCRNTWMVQGTDQYAFCADAVDAGVSHRICMQTLIKHLHAYLTAHPGACYEEWVADAHPENSCFAETNRLEIDERFYHETSDHRLLWNEKVATEHPDRLVHQR